MEDKKIPIANSDLDLLEKALLIAVKALQVQAGYGSPNASHALFQIRAIITQVGQHKGTDRFERLVKYQIPRS